MELEIWQLWFVIGIALFIIEIFTPAFLAASFGIGGLMAGIVTYFFPSQEIALVAFSVGTLLSFFTIRPFILKYASKTDIKTNVDALVGKIGKVTEDINNDLDVGRINVEGDSWKAVSANDEIITVGAHAEVLEVNSTILIVKLVTKK